MFLHATRPTAARFVGLVAAFPPAMLVGSWLWAPGIPLPVATSVVIGTSLAGWLLGAYAATGGWQHLGRAVLAADLAAAGAGVFPVFLAAALADGLLDVLATGAFVEWGLFVWAFVGLPLLIAGLPFSLAWVAVVRLVVSGWRGRVRLARNGRSTL